MLFRSHPIRWPAEGLRAIACTTVAARRVAVFQYEYGDKIGSAEVLALSHREFDLSNLRLVAEQIHSTRNMVVIAWTEADTTYVAVLKNWSPENLKLLLSRPERLT